MDVGLDAGAVQKSGLQVQGLGELQAGGLVSSLTEQLLNERAHLFVPLHDNLGEIYRDNL
jgi:hypothetical protein